jgi:hypothetical protein
MTTCAHIAEYLAEQTPDHEGDVCVAFTSQQRDMIVQALMLRDAVEPFVAFARSRSFQQFGDNFILTKGSPMAHRQLTAGQFRTLLAAVGEMEGAS